MLVTHFKKRGIRPLLALVLGEETENGYGLLVLPWEIGIRFRSQTGRELHPYFPPVFSIFFKVQKKI